MICPFFGICGGCAYQNLTAEEYRQLKLNFIQNALLHEGLSFPLEDMIEIGIHSRRRATFAVVNGHLGFNALKSHQIVEMTECRVLEPNLERLMMPLRELAKSLKQDADIAVLMTPFGADITVKEHPKKQKRFAKRTKSKEQDVLFTEDVVDFCRKNNVARFVYNESIMYQSVQLPFPANVFMQPSEKGEKALIDLVLSACQNSTKIADLFCGLGTFSKPLATQNKKVKAFDITFESIDYLNKQGVQAFVRDLFRQPLTPEELKAFDCVVLDPARAGAAAQVKEIANSDLKKVVMVSCNPITFAKDCKTLINAGFEFEKITPVDQFTYTQHIEVVATLKRK